MQQEAFSVGQEAEEIRHLWRASHQKVLLDEPWLRELLGVIPSPRQALDNWAERAEQVTIASALNKPRTDWDDALEVPTFVAVDR